MRRSMANGPRSDCVGILYNPLEQLVFFPMPHSETTRPTLDDDLAVLARAATLQIEALSDRPPAYSRTAYTSRFTQHVVFANGAIKLEGEKTIEPREPVEMVQDLVAAVKAYRDTVKAPQLLVWRCEPQFSRDEKGHITSYARLCFETDTERRDG